MPDVLLWAHSRSPSGDILTLSKGKEEASEKDAERGEGNLKLQRGFSKAYPVSQNF